MSILIKAIQRANPRDKNASQKGMSFKTPPD